MSAQAYQTSWPNGVRLVVTGGRDFADRDFVFEKLGNIHRTAGIKRLAHGGCRGADALAAQWARENGVECIEYPADWKTHKRAAGPLRNRWMLFCESPDIVVAFPGGDGTQDCMRQARNAGFVVVDLRMHLAQQEGGQ